MNNEHFYDDRSPDEINALLFSKGLRPCPHSHHSSDEEFAGCTSRKKTNFTFTTDDQEFLRAVGISVEPTFDDARLALAQRIAKHQAPVQVSVAPDAARLALSRRYSEESLTAVAMDFNAEPAHDDTKRPDIDNAPSAGDCDEPNYMTLGGFPICSKCGKSTRNRNALMCSQCRNRTRLLLNAEDKKWLREMGISR